MTLIVCMGGLLGLFTPKRLKAWVVGAYASVVTGAVFLGGIPAA